MPTAPYDTIGAVLDATRVRVNDAIAGIGGQTLMNNKDFTLVYVNDGWLKLQEYLLSLGFTGFARLKEEVILSSVPAIENTDWGSQLQLSWTSTPPLPKDFISPLKLWERPVGYQKGFLLMDQVLNGIPSAPKQSRNIVWDWRNDQINLPGTTVPFDLRMRYMAYLANFTDLTVATQPVPIMRCRNAFANFIAAEFSGARGDMDVSGFLSAAKEDASMIYSRDTAQANAIFKPSEYGKMGDAMTPGNTAQTPAVTP